jgi:hypothetical protein
MAIVRRRESLIERMHYPFLSTISYDLYAMHLAEPTSGTLVDTDLIKISTDLWWCLMLVRENERYATACCEEIANIVAFINRHLGFKEAPLQTTMLLLDGMICKWSYVEKEDCYKIRAAWRVHYREEPKEGELRFYVSSRAKAEFNRIREKKPNG